LKRIFNLELHDLEKEEEESNKKSKVEVIIDDDLEKEAQLGTRTLEKIQKEFFY